MPQDRHPGARPSRREFLALSAAAGAFWTWGSRAGLAAPPGAPWYATMRRCGQLNLNEKDPLTLDVAAWAEYWASLRIDAMLIGGGGIVAFYPTQVPYHHRSEFLGARDLFGELAAAVRRRGIRVVARMDCNYAWEDALRARPEWFERNRDGSPRPHGESTWLFKTCMFSPYFTEQMPAIYREIDGRYGVDAFFTNGWPSTGALGVCWCESCRRLYRDRVGGDPPEQTDATSALYRKYYAAHMDRVMEVWALWDGVARARRADSVYVGNLGGGARVVKDVWRIARGAGWFNADHQGRGGDTPIWDCAQQGRVAQAVMKGGTITNVTGAYSNSRPTWRHVAKPAAETTLWLAQTTASGMVPWYHWLGGSPEDERWRETGRAFFRWLAANEPHFRNRRSLADVAVLFPQSTIAFYRTGEGQRSWRGADRAQTTDYLQGLYYALLEGRLLFDFVHEQDLGPETLRRYRALVLPNAAHLDDEACRAVRAYAAAGGGVLATFETARYDRWGDARAEPALAELFGVAVTGDVVGPLGNSYMRVERRHAILDGLEGTALLPGPEERLPVRAREAAPGPAVLTVVPYYPAFPPEMVYPRTPRTDEPALVLREGGGGRTAYFAGDVDRTAWRSGSPDLNRLLVNAVRWVMGEPSPSLAIDGEGIFETFAWETEKGLALHLVNYTNPNMTRGFVRRSYPIGPLRCALATSPGLRVTRVQALRAGTPLPFTQEGGIVRFVLSSVADYEVVALT
jgi:putative glycosyl hydrolase-like family 6 (GHL6) protein/glycosyl hydrolase family 42 (putative beta-galactosidase)